MAFGMRDDVVRVYLGSWGFGFLHASGFWVQGLGESFSLHPIPNYSPFTP